MDTRLKERGAVGALTDAANVVSGEQILKDISDRTSKLIEASNLRQEKEKEQRLLDCDRQARERQNPSSDVSGINTFLLLVSYRILKDLAVYHINQFY